MVIKDIIQLMKAVEETDFDCFELSDQDFSLKLVRNQKHVRLSVGSPDGSALPPLITHELPPVEHEQKRVVIEELKGIESETDGSSEILSPLVGIYHEFPSEGAINKGDFIKEGTPVCLIEAMKLMNEIIMPEDGEITAVELKEGDTVEYNQVLFRYK